MHTLSRRAVAVVLVIAVVVAGIVFVTRREGIESIMGRPPEEVLESLVQGTGALIDLSGCRVVEDMRKPEKTPPVSTTTIVATLRLESYGENTSASHTLPLVVYECGDRLVLVFTRPGDTGVSRLVLELIEHRAPVRPGEVRAIVVGSRYAVVLVNGSEREMSLYTRKYIKIDEGGFLVLRNSNTSVTELYIEALYRDGGTRRFCATYVWTEIEGVCIDAGCLVTFNSIVDHLVYTLYLVSLYTRSLVSLVFY